MVLLALALASAKFPDELDHFGVHLVEIGLSGWRPIERDQVGRSTQRHLECDVVGRDASGPLAQALLLNGGSATGEAVLG